MKILMVCLGNICRSPLAHGILADRIERLGLDWTVDSAGTGDYHIGHPPDPRSIKEALRRGVDISEQRARQFQASDLDEFDLVLVMDASNYQNVQAFAKTQAHRDKIQLIMNFVRPGYNEQVPDPYWDDDGFAGVYDMLETAVDRLIERYRG